jgi:hypothetical protein
MSTKIYHGIRFKSKDIHQVTLQLTKIRDKAIELGNAEVNKNLGVAISVALTEKNKQFKEELTKEKFLDNPDTFIQLLEWEIENSFRAKSRKAYEPRFLFSVMLFSHSDGTLYGYYLDDGHPEYKKLLLEEIAEEFHYQNQTDPPENIPEDEFKKRGEIWDEILGSDSLIDRGWEFSIVRPEHFTLDRNKAKEMLKKMSLNQ